MIGVLAGLAGKLLPEAGKILDELHTSAEEKAAAKQKLEELLVKAEADAQKEVSDRWNADMKSDAWLPKNIRPLTLIFLTIVFTLLSVTDGNIGSFQVGVAYVPVFQTLLLAVYSSYFVGRSIEKIKGKSDSVKGK
jgi:hypothetical protein